MKKKLSLFIIPLAFCAIISTSAISVDFTNPDNTNFTYNRTNAYNYMQSYTTTPNLTKANYMSVGGDCTNFASQVVNEGGLSYLYGANRYSNNSWYYGDNSSGSNPSSNSASWLDADYFRKHWANKDDDGYNRAYKYTVFTVDSAVYNFASIRAAVWAGDIIQHVRASDGLTTHTQIVHSFPLKSYPSGGTYYDIQVSQHSDTSLNFTFKGLYDYLIDKQNSGLGSNYVCVIQIRKGY